MEIVMRFFRWIRSWHPLARIVLWDVERRIARLRERQHVLQADNKESLNSSRQSRLSKEFLALANETRGLEDVGEGLRDQIAGKYDTPPKLRRVA